MEQLKVKLFNYEFDNPIIPASGTFGYGYEFSVYYDINILGSLVTKATTLNPVSGNSTPRIAEAKMGMLNSIGLENPGIDNVINHQLKELAKIYKKKAIINIAGFSLDEYIDCVRKLNTVETINIIEINLSCPNVAHGGLAFGTDPIVVEEITRAIKQVSNKQIIIKLSPNVTDIVEIAKAVELGGADGISLINTVLAMRIDLKTGKPLLANITGGLSGPAILPLALRMVYQVYQNVKIPIIGVGGISNTKDVLEMMMAGASLVQIGSANLINPYICKEIIEELPKTMEKYNITQISEIIGRAYNG